MLRIVALLLYAVILLLLYVVTAPRTGISVLLVVPVALLALTNGLRGGLVGAVLAVVVWGVWAVTTSPTPGLSGWTTRLIAWVVVGVIVGRYEDTDRASLRRRMDERYAVEVHDRVVQALVLAHYQLATGEDAGHAVNRALDGAKDIISSRLGDVAPGDLRLEKPA
jgi:hypothetical protein